MTNKIFDTLKVHYQQLKTQSIIKLMQQDPQRFEHCSVAAAGIVFDFAKQRVTQETLQYLQAWSKAALVKEKISALALGQSVNVTEGRPALHQVLRDFSDTPLFVKGQNIKIRVKQQREQIQQLIHQFRASNQYTNIIHVGVGGSYLGPALLYDAFSTFAEPRFRCYFLANLSDPKGLLQQLDPTRTLMVIASKSFTTQEPMQLAQYCRNWLASKLSSTKMQQQIIAVTAEADIAKTWGIHESNILSIDESIGGRYSLWSAMSVSVMLAFGYEAFHHLLQGAETLDKHFMTAPLTDNLPVIHALLALWKRQFVGVPHYTLLPYEAGLKLLPSFCQQLWMESLGKSITTSGQPLNALSGPLVWGDLGVLSQHSVAQWLHQGSDPVQVEFIMALTGPGEQAIRENLIANCLSQARTLLVGKSKAAIQKIHRAHGLNEADSNYKVPHQVLAGDRGSQILILKHWDPFHLGALLAMYEHSVYVQSVMLNINAFDQFGVEWGKQLAHQLQSDLTTRDCEVAYDASTQALIKLYQAQTRESVD